MSNIDFAALVSKSERLTFLAAHMRLMFALLSMGEIPVSVTDILRSALEARAIADELLSSGVFTPKAYSSLSLLGPGQFAVPKWESDFQIWDKALIEWAKSRWIAEVENRPLSNRNRRPLDDTWRQVVRYAGGNPDELLGPSHDALFDAAKGE